MLAVTQASFNTGLNRWYTVRANRCFMLQEKKSSLSLIKPITTVDCRINHQLQIACDGKIGIAMIVKIKHTKVSLVVQCIHSIGENQRQNVFLN